MTADQQHEEGGGVVGEVDKAAGPPPNKRQRNANEMLVEYNTQQQHRTSSLPSPTMKLTGHSGSIYAVEYSPNGETLCSASFDMTCLLWNHRSSESQTTVLDQELEAYSNYNVLKGHKNAVLDCTWLDNDTLVTASADKTLQLWNVLTGERIRKFKAHEGIVNACCCKSSGLNISSTQLFLSASDDKTCRLWDARQKQAALQLDYDYSVTAVAATDTHVYTGSLDNLIVAWDLKQNHRKQFAMRGHSDTITCLKMHPQHTHVLSNSMDHSLRSWDIRPFIATPDKRHDKTFTGHKHNAEKGLLKCAWNATGSMVTCGSADKLVHVWDEFSTQELYLLPGHRGCVNCVTFHPTEQNVLVSGASDKQIFVGELS